MGALRLALRSLGREWRSGELAVLLVSLCVAITALSGVSFLVDRIGRAVQLQAAEILAADLRLESDAAPAPAVLAAIRERGLSSAQLTSMPSVVFAGDVNQLANVRAVSAGYPLRGALQIADQPFATGRITHELPGRGECWPDSRLAAALGVAVGGQLSVGASTLKVTRILIARPDQNSTFVEFAPALLINAEDLPATQLIQPASRVNYAVLIAGERSALQSFRGWQQQRRQPGERLADVADSSPQIGSANKRASSFLALASLVAVLLCAVAIAMSARGFVRRHLDVVALLKTLGASRRFVLGVSLLQLLALAITATVIGATAGWLTQFWLVRVLQGLLRTDLPPAGMLPVLIGFVIAVAMLAGFALPSMWQLTRVPALRVLRRDLGPPTPGLWLGLLPAAATLAVVIFVVLQDARLALWFVVGLAGAIAVLVVSGLLLVRLASVLRGGAGAAWRYGLANLARRRTDSIALLVSFGLGALLLVTLAILRNDLLADWRSTLPENVPNYFFLNIPPAQRDAFSAQATQLGARLERMLPMVRGRLVSINGQDTATRRFEGQRGRGFADREQNLTWAEQLGEDNRVVAGRWWDKGEQGQPLVSLATEFQEQLGLKLGDKLVFDVAGEQIEVTVASFRKVRWDSFRPNFFIVFEPGLLDGAAGTYMTSALFEPRTGSDLATLVRNFPSVSVFNVGDLLNQVRSVIDKASRAVQSVFVFTLLAGLTVLLAAVQASRDERRFEAAVLRTLGARRPLLRTSTLVEFAVLGACAGLMAVIGASVAGWLLARNLDLRFHFSPWICAAGIAGSTLLVGIGGWLATRGVLNQPPRAALN
ncbi:MAG: hypothetical protein QM718_11090 [Steroidobacteraceae bacterium]